MADPAPEQQYEEHLQRFLEGATVMINTPQGYSTSTLYGTALHVVHGPRFDLVRGETDPLCNRSYVFARIERETGDIYSHAGKKPRGSLYSAQSGLDAVSRNGVIVGNKSVKTGQ